MVVNDVALPGIDRGLALHDAPQDPVDRARRGAGYAPAVGCAAPALRARQRDREVQGRIGADPPGGDAFGQCPRDGPPGVGRLRPGGHSGRRRSRARGERAGRRGPTSSTRRRATSTTRCSGPTTSSTRGSGTSRRSTWSGPGTSTPARPPTSSSRCSTAAWPSATRWSASRSSRSGSNRTGRSTPGSASSTCPSRRRPISATPAASSSPRDFIWDDDLPLDIDGHGTHVAGTIGQATNNTVGAAGMAFNVRIMPVKVISERVGRHLRQPQLRHRRPGGARHPLRRRQRRARHQHEHRPRERRPGAGDRSRGGVRGVARRVRRHRRRQRRQRRQPAEPHRRVRAAHRRRGRRRRGRAALDRAYYSTTGIFVELAAPGRRSARLGRRRDPPADGRPGPLADLPARARPSSGRRASTPSSSTSSRARRWRRRTSRDSRRCCGSRASPIRRRSKRR